MDYVLSELPPIDSVEILRLRGHRGLESQSCGKVAGETAQKIAELWRQLPYAGQDRCHMPPYGLRFFQGDVEVLYCSICWKCNNIWIVENGVRKSVEFDAEAEVSQQLFQLIEATVDESEDD